MTFPDGIGWVIFVPGGRLLDVHPEGHPRRALLGASRGVLDGGLEGAAGVPEGIPVRVERLARALALVHDALDAARVRDREREPRGDAREAPRDAAGGDEVSRGDGEEVAHAEGGRYCDVDAALAEGASPIPARGREGRRALPRRGEGARSPAKRALRRRARRTRRERTRAGAFARRRRSVRDARPPCAARRRELWRRVLGAEGPAAVRFDARSRAARRAAVFSIPSTIATTRDPRESR